VTEQTAPSAPASIPTVRVVQDIPVVFADGVMSQAYGQGIAKFYLYRTDASPNASELPKNVPFLQVVMPAHGFAVMLHFFEHRLKLMINDQTISQEAVDEIKKTVYSAPQPANVSNP
jgi:hypothetical protein